MTSQITSPKRAGEDGGIGDATRDGTLRSVSRCFNFKFATRKINKNVVTRIDSSFMQISQEVNETSREKWYKKMYNTIHKAKDDGNDSEIFTFL